MPCALCHPDCQAFYLSPLVECWKQKRLHTICKILIWICFLSNSGAKRIWQKLICLYWLMIWWIQKSHADFGTSCIMTQALLAQPCYLYRVTPCYTNNSPHVGDTTIYGLNRADGTWLPRWKDYGRLTNKPSKFQTIQNQTGVWSLHLLAFLSHEFPKCVHLSWSRPKWEAL